MNYKKANWAFCGMVILHFAAVFALLAVSRVYTLGIVENLVFSELLLVIPAALTLLFSGEKKATLCVRRMKISSALMTLLYTFLMMPLTTLLNAVSMLFVDNAVGSISTQVLDMPFLLAFFLMAVMGPVCEEFCFRGVIYRGLLKSGNAVGALLFSSLLFGLIHMNFNQAPYAFVLGIAMALIMEATGTLLAPILVHVVFNGVSVVQMYAYEYVAPGLLEEQMQMEYGMDEMAVTISVYCILALVCTAVAACVLVWIAKNQKREGYLAWLLQQKAARKVVTIPGIIAVIACLIYMLLTAVLL